MNSVGYQRASSEGNLGVVKQAEGEGEQRQLAVTPSMGKVHKRNGLERGNSRNSKKKQGGAQKQGNNGKIK